MCLQRAGKAYRKQESWLAHHSGPHDSCALAQLATMPKTPAGCTGLTAGHQKGSTWPAAQGQRPPWRAGSAVSIAGADSSKKNSDKDE